MIPLFYLTAAIALFCSPTRVTVTCSRGAQP